MHNRTPAGKGKDTPTSTADEKKSHQSPTEKPKIEADEKKSTSQRVFDSNALVLTRILEFLPAQDLLKIKEKGIFNVAASKAAKKLLEDINKAPTLSQMINLFPPTNLWEVFPELARSCMPAAAITKDKLGTIVEELKRNDSITDSTGHLHCTHLMEALKANGMLIEESNLLLVLFKPHKLSFSDQIMKAMSTCVCSDSKDQKSVTPYTKVPKLAEMLYALCLFDGVDTPEITKKLLPEAVKQISSLPAEYQFSEADLPVYVATFLIANMKKVDMPCGKDLATVAYQRNLMFLFKTLLNREDVCKWINNVPKLVTQILMDDKAVDFHLILINSRACLNRLTAYENYFDWCRNHFDRAIAVVISQSRTLKNLLKELSEDSSIGFDMKALLTPLYPQLLKQKDKDGHTVLYKSIVNQYMEAVLFLLKQKDVDLEAKTDNNENILHAAIQEAAKAKKEATSEKDPSLITSKIILSMLISHQKITPLLTWHDHPKCYDQTPVLYACEMGLLDIAVQLQKRSQQIPDEKLALAASIDAPIYEHKGQRVSALEYHMKIKSDSAEEVLNLIAVGAKYKFTDADESYIDYLTREMVYRNRIDALEPLCQLGKESGQEELIKLKIRQNLENRPCEYLKPKEIEFYIQYISAPFSALNAQDLTAYQKICTDRLDKARDKELTLALTKLDIAIGEKQETLKAASSEAKRGPAAKA